MLVCDGRGISDDRSGFGQERNGSEMADDGEEVTRLTSPLSMR